MTAAVSWALLAAVVAVVLLVVWMVFEWRQAPWDPEDVPRPPLPDLSDDGWDRLLAEVFDRPTFVDHAADAGLVGCLCGRDCQEETS